MLENAFRGKAMGAKEGTFSDADMEAFKYTFNKTSKSNLCYDKMSSQSVHHASCHYQCEEISDRFSVYIIIMFIMKKNQTGNISLYNTSYT